MKRIHRGPTSALITALADDPFPDWIRQVIADIARERGGVEAEEFEVWLFHDVADRRM